jgi:hypothetical protein
VTVAREIPAYAGYVFRSKKKRLDEQVILAIGFTLPLSFQSGNSARRMGVTCQCGPSWSVGRRAGLRTGFRVTH